MIGLRIFLAMVLFLLCETGMATGEPKPREAGRAILVLDASGSMWGRVSGRTKVEIARESIERLMETWNPDIELGLVAYGHRRKGDCKDIELVLPVARNKREDVIKAVHRLNARGKTPLSDSVRQAAEILSYTSERATVILISDGLETCGMDPCALAEKLEQEGIAFTAHVIGFDLKKEELPALKCIAEGTGGMFIEAVDAASLTEALTSVEEAVAAAPPAPRVPPATQLAAVLKKGMEPLEGQEINWTVTSPEKDAGGTYKTIGLYRHTRPRIRLGTGRYRVVVKTSQVVSESWLEINESHPKEHLIDLQAGQVTLIGYNKEGGKELRENVRWFLNKAPAEVAGRGDNLTYTNFASPTYTLPAGRYEMVLQSGLARVAATVYVNAGEVLTKKAYLNAGQVKLQAFLSEGGPPVQKSLEWVLTGNDPGPKGEYEQISRNSYRTPTFTLGAGRHRFVVTVGSVQKAFEVEIEPDRLVEKKVILEAGRVTLLAVDGASGKQLEKAYWTITRPEPDPGGGYGQIARSTYHTPGFTLSPGRYRVIIEHSGKRSSAMIDIKTGDMKEVRINVAGGR
ncbi:MAG: VWA domain-containing protein [Acidobacteriota bacterium]